MVAPELDRRDGLHGRRTVVALLGGGAGCAAVAPNQSTLIFAAWITSDHFLRSAWIVALNSSGEPERISMPLSTISWMNFGCFVTVAMARFQNAVHSADW